MQTVLVVCLGAQHAQLVDRRAREARAHSEILPHTISLAEVSARKPAVIVLSGGLSSVDQDGAHSLDPVNRELGIPVFGICSEYQDSP